MASAAPRVSYVSSDSKQFLDMVVSTLRWKDLSGDIVMDVGCGNPKIKLADHLVHLFPDVQQVVCVDKNAVLIMYLQMRNRATNVFYKCGDIEHRSTLAKWEGQVAKVFSVHCFHMLKHQRVGFENVYNLLKPGGEAAILFCVQSGYVGWHCELRENSKWNQYYNGNSPEVPTTQLMKIDDSYYKNMLEDIGFRIVLCAKDKIGVPCESENSWKELILKLALSSFHVPNGLLEEFKADLTEAFFKHNCRTTNGLPCQTSYFLTALLRKPDIMNQ